MKAFGVRLAAGVATILFGAYAAALAQKDKQNDSTAWTAQPPSLGEPAAPIAGIGEDTWISQPESDASNSLADFAGSAFNQSVALVQHTEDVGSNELRGELRSAPADSEPAFDVSSLPASLGEPQSESAGSPAMAMEVPDWTMDAPPASQQNFPEPETYPEPQQQVPEQSLSMNFPSEVANQEPGFAPEPMQEIDLAQAPAMDMAPAMDIYPDPVQSPSNDLRSMPDHPEQPAQFDSLANQQPDFAQNQLQPAPPAADPYPVTQQPGQFQNNAYPSQPERFASLPRPDAAPMAATPGMGLRGGYQSMPPEQSVARNEPSSGTIDAPGDRRLEGVQTPSVVIQKRAPAEVQVGKPASFVIHVQNVGSAEALDVVVHDRIPAGMRLVDASPSPTQQGNQLLWQLGSLPAGDERTVTMQLVPEAEGELGSVARVTFEAAASVRTISTRPELKITQRAPAKVLIGQQLEIELEVSNPGTGEATSVSLQEDVPEGLEHPRGRQLDNLIGTLAPGESRLQVLRLRAVKPGMIANTIHLVSEDGLAAEHTIDVEVIAPQLAVELAGPSRRFLERQATYQLNIANTGTADATNVEISVALDRGFNFVSTDFEGQYDASRHAVFWSLDSLPAGDSGSVPLTLLPVQEGQRALTVDARADLNTIAKSEHTVQVEGFAELSFQILNPGGPIELGAQSDYEIMVQNSGSKTDNNVRLQIQLPAGLELVSADGEGGQANTDGRGVVIFPPRNQLSPGSEIKYRMRVRGVAPGTHLVKAVVVSDSATVPVTKEESTLVYADQ
ncbi:Large cysteine-rich periplasmic protein OmcB precursor [Rubripirellula obstinata]|uniref:Large cysteine-rich periplasmic protein OmcB n=2 Tax=Rubripirellula obstinata TaxID=406547 RepID=A0A5B1CHX2_9BACT|nr:Large cysteine-rich periplasmic protein OmcB precursor [Rubripirellula obstinata]